MGWDDKEEETFVITLYPQTAWAIRKRIIPGPLPFPGRDFSVSLRTKINDVILRFEDEADIDKIDVDITEKEGWAIDSIIEYDGKGGAGTDLLIQIYRGFWSLRTGLPQEMRPEKDVSAKQIMEELLGNNDPEGEPENPLPHIEINDDDSLIV